MGQSASSIPAGRTRPLAPGARSADGAAPSSVAMRGADAPTPALVRTASYETERRRVARAAAVIVVAMVGFVWWRAWVADDAFITFRHVVNCRAGYGPVFNVGERVQGFTHPLWFLVLLAGSFVADVFTVAVVAGLLVTAAIVVILAVWLRDRPFGLTRLVFVAAVLASCHVFVEYQTSGLETSLTDALVVALFALLLRRTETGGPAPLFWAAMFCSLLVVNRPDHVVLTAPLWIWLVVVATRRGGRRGALPLAAAILPALAWYGFATIYYGTPLPNTAYAKLALTWRSGAYKGSLYALDFLRSQWLHAGFMLLVLVGGAVVLVRDAWRRRPGAGVPLLLLTCLWLNVAYITLSGGDFMRARWFISTFVGTAMLAGYLASRWPTVGEFRRPVFAAVIAMAACAPLATYDPWPRFAAVRDSSDIADEYALFRVDWSVNRFRVPATPRQPTVAAWVRLGEQARRYADAYGPIAIQFGALGHMAYHAGPKVTVVDYHALTDAFIARLPGDPWSRVGHVWREIPRAYLEQRGVIDLLPNWQDRLERLDPTLAADARAMAQRARWDDPQAAVLNDLVRTMTTGPVWSWSRLRLIPRYTALRR